MRHAHVQFVHASDAVTYADARRVVRALRKQVRDHFGPAWGIRAEIDLVQRAREDLRAWHIVIVDSESRARDLGWHELTAGGLPLGKIYTQKVIHETGGWSSTASHELLEMLADPDMSLEVLVQGDRGSRIYAYEVCDPVQDDRFAYRIDGVLVSDFVTPAWFESFHEPRSARFDHVRACTRPLQVLAGGYASFHGAQYTRGWRDLGPSRGVRGRARGSRSMRRRLDREEWRRSRR